MSGFSECGMVELPIAGTFPILFCPGTFCEGSINWEDGASGAIAAGCAACPGLFSGALAGLLSPDGRGLFRASTSWVVEEVGVA